MRPWAWIVCVFDGPMPSLSVGTVTTLWPHICMKQTQNVISSNSSEYLHSWLQLTHTCFIQNIIMFCISLIERRFLNILIVDGRPRCWDIKHHHGYGDQSRVHLNTQQDPTQLMSAARKKRILSDGLDSLIWPTRGMFCWPLVLCAWFTPSI